MLSFSSSGLLCLLLSGRSLFVQAKAISDMRAYVRKEHVDVRANTVCFPFTSTYSYTHWIIISIACCKDFCCLPTDP